MRGLGYTAVATAATCVLLYGCNSELVTPVATRPTLHPTSTQPRKAIAAAAQTGQWSAVFAWPIVGAHMSVLPDGRLLTWTSNDMDHTYNDPYVFLWDPTTSSFTQVPNAFTDVFCSSHSFLADGRLFVAGGHVADGTGSKDGNIFDFRTSSWSQLPKMRAGRWYPSTVTLGDGEIGVAAGGDENQNPNPIPEVWDGTKFRVLNGAPLVLPTYPWLHLAPDGRVFNSGPDQQTRYLNPSGDGEWVNAGQHINSTYRDYGAAVMYEAGKLIAIGGGDPPVNTAELVNLNVGTTWTSTSSMQFARRQFNALALADGKVLVVGGTNAPGFNTESGSIYTPELWNPATGSWTAMADMTIPRTYHSTAVLMPDARVLSAGGGRCGTCQVNHLDAQIFSPPYLFNADGSAATRPTITSAPTTLNRGQSFTVSTPDAARITKATMARLPSTSHGFNMNQAFVSLPVAQTTGGVQLTAPANPNLVPAGHYMLFLLDGNGVPSTAKIVQLLGTGAAPAPPSVPSAPSSLSAAPASSAINLKWSDNSTSESSFRIERCQGSGCASFAEIAFVGANVTSYANTGLTSGTTYGYRVRAMNAAGGSAYTNVATTTASTTTLSTLKNRAAARCMEVPGASHTNFTQLTLQDCNGAVNQQWSTLPIGISGEIRVYGDKCMDGNGAENGGTNGDKISIYDCHGGTNQQWTRTAAGEIRNFTGLMCIDVSGKATANSSPLVLWTCDGTNSQKWDPPSSTPTNTPPTANFTSSCNALACAFTNTSTDADGTIASSGWTFGDGSSSTATSPSHTYGAGGSYSVALTVTDDKGATNSTTKSVSVTASPPPPPPPTISLTARGSKVKGVQQVDLTWSGATTSTVDLYRNGAVIAQPANNTTTKSGTYHDNLNRKGSATYQYKVCQAGSTTVCSSVATVVF